MKLIAEPRKMPSMAGFGLEVTGYAQSGRENECTPDRGGAFPVQ